MYFRFVKIIDKIFFFLSQSNIFNIKQLRLFKIFQNSVFYNSFTYRLLRVIVSSVFNIYSILLSLFFYLIIVPYHFLPPVNGIPIFKLIPLFIIAFFYIFSFTRLDSKKIYNNRKFILLILGYLFVEFISSLNFAILKQSIINFLYFEYSFLFIFLFFINSDFEINKLKIIFIFFIGFVTIIAIYGDLVKFFGEPGIFKKLLNLTFQLNPSMRIIYTHFNPSSAFGNDSMRATLISMLIPIFFTYINFKRDNIKNIFLWVWFLVVILSIILCQTTGPFFALSLTLIIQFFLFYKNQIIIYFHNSRKLILIAIIVIVIGGIVAILGSNDFAIVHRLIQWKVAFNIFIKHPFLGIGTGNYSSYADNFKSYYADLPQHAFYNVADNYILTYIVEHGILGLVLLFFIFLHILKKLKKDNVYSLSIFFILIYIFLNSLTWDVGNHLSFRVIFAVFLSIFYFL